MFKNVVVMTAVAVLLLSLVLQVILVVEAMAGGEKVIGMLSEILFRFGWRGQERALIVFPLGPIAFSVVVLFVAMYRGSQMISAPSSNKRKGIDYWKDGRSVSQ